LQIPFKENSINYKIDTAQKPIATIILAHGAGAGMDHPFLDKLAFKLSENGITTIRFNFPYIDAGRKSPGSPKKNVETWNAVLEYFSAKNNSPLFISGKSYGGRMASHLVAETPTLSVKGIVYFGFPLHAPGKASKDRAAHLSKISVPQLFLQGENDKLADINLMDEVIQELPKANIHKFPFADHSFKTPKSAGISYDQMIQQLAEKTFDWISSVIY